MAAVAVAPAGAVAAAVAALVEKEELLEGSYAASLAALALAQAEMADAGNTHAASALRTTLGTLDEVAGLRPLEDGEWFTLMDIRFSIKREGIDPRSKIGQALLDAGKGEMLSCFPPPTFPEGWRGTMVDGDPAEWARENGCDWSYPAPLGFWPEQPCPDCGHDRRVCSSRWNGGWRC